MTFRSRKFSLLSYYSIDRNSRAAAVRVMIFLLIYSRMGKSSSKQNQFDLKVDDFSRFDRAHVTTINHAPGVRGCLYQIKSKNRTSKNNFLRQNYTIVSRDRRHPTFETSSRLLLRFIIRSAMETNIRRTSNLVTIVHGLKQSNRFLTRTSVQLLLLEQISSFLPDFRVDSLLFLRITRQLTRNKVLFTCFPSWQLIIRIIADSGSRTWPVRLFTYFYHYIERIYVSPDQWRAYTTGSSTDSAWSVKSLEI